MSRVYNPDTGYFQNGKWSDATPFVTPYPKPQRASVRNIETAEYLREYEADKLLHDAYKLRDEMSMTHSYDRLLRKWVDHFSQPATPADVDATEGVKP